MQVAHLCVSGGWVGSLYNQQFSQPALSTGSAPHNTSNCAYRRPSAIIRAERSVLVASIPLFRLLLSLSSLIPRAKRSVLVAALLLVAPPRSSGLHPAPGVAPQPARGPAQ